MPFTRRLFLVTYFIAIQRLAYSHWQKAAIDAANTVPHYEIFEPPLAANMRA